VRASDEQASLAEMIAGHRIPPHMQKRLIVSHEETNEPLLADHRNFYKVEKWSRDGQRVEQARLKTPFLLNYSPS
jgi:hypothetical protein